MIAGILCLLGFFASYLTALSWADLTFVLPATAFGYVVVALLSKFWLHETVSLYRWAGIMLIVCGVGFVANGPSLTQHPRSDRWKQPRDARMGGANDASPQPMRSRAYLRPGPRSSPSQPRRLRAMCSPRARCGASAISI